ncbi:MAG: hypothetical protein WKF43_09395 [Acidimicrobiales bacterium]
MKLANLDGRATVLVDGGGIDVAEATQGRFGPDVQSICGLGRLPYRGGQARPGGRRAL